MARNGDLSKKFGVFRTICCGEEIVIAEGARFPDCPRHLNLPTEWKPVNDDKIRHVFEEAPLKKKADPAA